MSLISSPSAYQNSILSTLLSGSRHLSAIALSPGTVKVHTVIQCGFSSYRTGPLKRLLQSHTYLAWLILICGKGNEQSEVTPLHVV